MSWTDYKRLIESCNTDPADWQSAAAGNPNDPLTACKQAVLECGPWPVAEVLLTFARRALAQDGGQVGEVTGPDPELVDCPACNGQGTIYPGAKVGHWAGLMPWPADVAGERCELCGGSGEVDRATAAEYEAAQLAELGEVGTDGQE